MEKGITYNKWGVEKSRNLFVWFAVLIFAKVERRLRQVLVSRAMVFVEGEKVRKE